ncbi:hypothetical protein C8Q76DRAFT_801785 [Earliella scabrosa]|nr:hypothetical protein C8Q76DRAFT_801785 [Earliella scabrosa]
MKLSDRFLKLYRKLIGDEALQLALAGTIKTLQTGRDLTELAPVPGLPVVLDVLIAILEKVQNTQSNGDAVKGLCEQIKGVHAAIQGAAGAIRTEIDRIPGDCPDRAGAERKLHIGLNQSLTTPTDDLQTLLNQVHEEATALANKPWRVRFFHSKANAEAINGMKEKIGHACQNFQLQCTRNIETLSRTTLRELMKEVHTRILKDLGPLDGASYRSGDNTSKAQYLETTRESVFRELESWVETSSKERADKRVFVLVGAAGMGKSTIASELCRQLDNSKRLGASFFFTRGLQGPNSVRAFFNTVSSQLATRAHLARGGSSQQIEYACKELVQEPLRQLSESESNPHSPIFVVVDALDECTAEDIDAVRTLLELLLSCTESPSSPLRILLTSRPEPDSVRHILDAHPSVLRRTFRDIGDQDTVDRDIEAVIHDRLSKDSTTRAWSDLDPSIIKRLVRWSEGIFVYASTAAEFLVGQAFGGTNNLNETLHLLSKSNDHSSGLGLERLDKLYITVLDTAFPNAVSPPLRKKICLVLGLAAVWQRSWISTPWLEVLTGISADDSRNILNQLRAVITNSRVNEFRIMHTTFRDFLLDPEKTKALPRPEFHVDAAQAHGTLALGCMRLGLYYVEKYMPELLEESSEMLELRKLEDKDLRDRLREKLRGKKVDEPEHSVESLCFYSAEMIETAERFDQIPTNVFIMCCLAIHEQFVLHHGVVQ